MLVVRAFFLAYLVTLDRKVGGLGIANKFRVRCSGRLLYTRNGAQRLQRAVHDLRCAVFAVAGAGRVETEGHQVTHLESDRLPAKVVERAGKESCPPEEHDTECDLHSHCNFAEALRVPRRGSGVLTKRVGKV